MNVVAASSVSSSSWLSAAEPVLGVLLLAIALLNVFLTVLYARVGTGIISAHLARRAEWDETIRRLAPAMAYRMKEVDPAVPR